MIVANKDQTREMFEKNINLLTPWLREAVLKIDERELWNKIKVTYNNEGYPVCSYHQNDQCFHINSIKPVEEAVNWYKTIQNHGSGVIFLYGCGFGYPVFELFAQKKPHTLVVVFEQDLFLFKAMLYYFDFEPIIQTQKIAFLVGDFAHFAAAFDQLFFSTFFISCTYPALAFTFPVQRHFKAQYLQLHRDIFSQLSLFAFYVGNDHKDNLIGLCNMLSNVKEVLENPYIGCLEGKYRNVPAFIIANGPSLDKNIRQLKEIGDRGLIISVESAILPLLKNGIKPDILAVIERTKNTYTYHFENIDYPNDIALLSLALADKHVYRSFPGERIPIFRDREVANQWLNGLIGDGSAIDAGANVSHLALELAAFMGADPIVFVGQDFAYGPEGTTHSKYAVYSEEKGRQARETIQSQPVVYVEGNDGKLIPSNQLWVDFKTGLEQKIAAHVGHTFINGTEGGAKINGTRCEQLSQVIGKYCTSPIPCRVNELILENKAEISPIKRKGNIIELVKSVENYAGLFREMALQTNKAKFECEKMIRLSLKNESKKYNGCLDNTYQNNVAIFNRFLSSGMLRCFSQQVVFSNYYLINRLGMIDTPEKITEIFKIHCNFFCQLSIVSQSISVHLENALDSLKDLLQDFEKTKPGCNIDKEDCGGCTL